ncbi:MAG: hypothetical protein GF346_13265, partial [Candidatus Eisenbacteria bacterium]|nr:hypothetical protein [Candidatus Latescibacterota bacterium]MBD3303409.1 hypothetical protein [Candidatus Eisenbacteria bacterium]
SFHFVLNDTIYKDNRIPPQGFTNAAFASFGGTPVDPDHEGPDPLYPDGQYWDEASYTLPAETRTVITTLYYQTTSKEYVEFLLNENETDDSGQLLYDLWVDNGRCPPVAMVADTAVVEVDGVADANTGGRDLRLRAGPSPSRGGLGIELETPRPIPVVLDLFDLEGRRVHTIELGEVAGSRRHVWDGRNDAGRPVRSGIYWLVMRAGERSRTQRVVLLR